MQKKIIQINAAKCNGCGACITACHENAIEMRNGKAVLVREDYCDGLGDCLPSCPMDAISFTEKEVKISRSKENNLNWPIQLKLTPPRNPAFDGRKLVIGADCTAFLYKDYHEHFSGNNVVLIGCPKLDAMDYSIKLTALLKMNAFSSIDIIRMEVPCCSGLEQMVMKAIKQSGRILPFAVTVISTEGKEIN